MRIVVPSAAIWGRPQTQDEGVEMLRRVEIIARLSHRSEAQVTDDSWGRVLRSVVLEHGDWSVAEHESVTVFVLCDRGVSHEWVRHRLGAYTQESTRFVNYKKKFGEIEFIQPSGLSSDRVADWKQAMTSAENHYMAMVSERCTSDAPDDFEKPVAPQIARSVLPNGLATRLFVTYNLRMWRHFFIMRTTQEAHPQMKEITLPLLQQFKARIPLFFDDIEPERKQSLSLARIR